MGNDVTSCSLNSVELEIARPFFLSGRNPVSYMSGIIGGGGSKSGEESLTIRILFAILCEQ